MYLKERYILMHKYSKIVLRSVHRDPLYPAAHPPEQDPSTLWHWDIL